MNGYSQRKFRKLYFSPKPVVKMKPNKLLASRIITSIHVRSGRVVKFKSTRYQLADDILMKRNFDNHIRKQWIQANAIRHRYFHKNKSPREKNAKPLHSVTIEHLSKSGKLNGVGKIFPNLFDLNKYNIITTIHSRIDDVEASQSFQTNGSKMMGVSYCLTSIFNSQHSIDYFLPNMQKTIVKHNEDWHERVAYQAILGTFSFYLVYGKKLIFYQNINLLSLLLAQFSARQSCVIQSQIEDLLKMENIRTNHVYASDNLSSQISNLVSNQDKVRKTEMKHARKF